MTTAVLYATLCTAAYYLVSRAKITSWLWSHYPSWLDYWTTCAACSGLWYGIGCGFLGRHLGLSLFGLAPDSWLAIAAAGAVGMVWTPIIAYYHVTSWEALLPAAQSDSAPSNAPSHPPDLRAL